MVAKKVKKHWLKQLLGISVVERLRDVALSNLTRVVVPIHFLCVPSNVADNSASL